jgi:SAM-dependent methyltransferase
MLDNLSKNKYGIVYTPNNLVKQMLNIIPKNLLQNLSLKWLDIGAGTGNFSQELFDLLNENLKNQIPNDHQRYNHILDNMLFMVEIYQPHIEILREKFKNNENIIFQDFLSYNPDFQFDFIIGNPPYNLNGAIKTPTNQKLQKKNDGRSSYVDFVIKSLDLLKDNGHLLLIIPTIWLKPDKAGLYNCLTNLKIKYLQCFSASQTMKLFDYKAQTPTCFFLIEKPPITNNNNNNNNNNNQKIIPIFDSIERKPINYYLNNNFPIPTNGIEIVNKLMYFINKIGYLKVEKTTTPSKKCKITKTQPELDDINFYNFYENITTCRLDNLSPKLVIDYSNEPCSYKNVKKLVLAHKMYGFAFFDETGKYGISSRDNYIISEKDYTLQELKQIQKFLSTKFALFIFSLTNYRMRYLEKSAFYFLPDISKIKDFPDLIDLKKDELNNKISDFFNFSQKERETIEKTHKNYNFFI